MTQTTQSRLSRTVTLGTVGVLAVAFAGCEEETAYCTTSDGVVVENRYCDDGDEDYADQSGYFWYVHSGGSGGTYVKGSRIPKSKLGAKGARVSASNKAAVQSRGFGSSARGSGSGIGRAGGSSGG